MKRFYSIVLALFLGLFVNYAQALDFSELGKLAIQDAGRIKPFDTFARESLQLVYGKATYNDQSAVEIVTTWLLAPAIWDEKDFVQLRRKDVKESLKVDSEKTYFKPKELFENPRLPLLVQELRNKLDAKEKLNPYYQDIQRLERQLSLYRAITMGFAFRLLPPREGDQWISVNDFKSPWIEHFTGITKNFIYVIGASQESNPDSLKDALNKFNQSVSEFKAAARNENPAFYPPQKDLDVEVHYNHLQPFQWAWIFYLVTAILMGAVLVRGKKDILYKLSWISILTGFIFHAYGFGLRIYLTGRPPVSNMYESVIWVSFGTLLFGMIFEMIYKKSIALLGASIVGVICLIVANTAVSILDPSLQPLEPVLRSNLWLTIHVLTITLSYSTFFLALLVSDIGIIYFLQKDRKKEANDQALIVYRIVQIGVVLLFIGTVLGGVWADYSWGRFWGWDPKETWAFITFLGYMAILHAKKAGYIKNFGFLISVVIAFSLVLMAWYGVNFILGAGFHTYGFGGGGVPYVAAFVGIHLIFASFAATVYRIREGGPSPRVA